MCSEDSPGNGQEMWHRRVTSESSTRGFQEGCVEALDWKLNDWKEESRHLSVSHFYYCYLRLYKR
jgi:hypothetical protein